MTKQEAEEFLNRNPKCRDAIDGLVADGSIDKLDCNGKAAAEPTDDDATFTERQLDNPATATRTRTRKAPM